MDRKGKIEADIRQHGWFVFKVVDNELPSFAYTVGFYATFNHPEVIISGLDMDIGHQLLNNIGQDIKDGIRRMHDQPYNDILEGYNCVFKHVTENTYQDFLGQAVLFYGEQKIPVLQCVYPDKSGRFPWDAEYMVNAQEILY